MPARRSVIFSLPSVPHALLAAACMGMVFASAFAFGAEAVGLARRLVGAPGVRQGLCVHVGCGDGRLTAQLGMDGRFVVHGLSASREEVGRAREHIRSLGLYGRVSVDYSALAGLPYTDGVANVLIAHDFPSLAARGVDRAEVLRVLAPRGVAWLESGGEWVRLDKPLPPDTDDWGQRDHDASRTAISSDTVVGPPASVRWVADDRWVDVGPGMGGIFSAGGRIFAFFPTWDEQVRLLVARDAYNGVKLWEKRFGVAQARVYPPFAAAGDRVFTVLQRNGPVVALDAATGELVKTYGFRGTMITWHDGVLIPGPGARTAWDAETGEQLWANKIGTYDPCVIGEGKIFAVCYGQKELAALSLETGEVLWRAPNLDQARGMCYRDGILFTKRQVHIETGKEHAPFRATNHAYSAADGRHLWSYSYIVHWHQGRADIFLLGGLAWVQADGPQEWIGLDPQTGEVKRKVPISGPRSFLRCYRDRATVNYILEDVGIGFFDFKRGTFQGFYGGRGTCGAGYTPANGLIYRTPDICVCFAQVRGTVALAPGPTGDLEDAVAGAVPTAQKGPAFGAAPDAAPGDDWPTYRHDPRRSGGVGTDLGPAMAPAWEQQVGAGVSSPVVAGGKVFVASTDEHQVVALDAASGRQAWRFTAGGRVDTPPTVHGGLVLFGSADGYVRCLAASDGRLVWRLRAAPRDRRTVVRGQLESLWPVHGSVLVWDGVAYFAAGRQSELDGGLLLYAADPATGRVIWRRRVVRKDMLRQRSVSAVVNTTNGLLVTDGELLFMDRAQFEPKAGADAEPSGRRLRMYGGACDFVEDIARPPHSWKHEWRRWAYVSRPVRGKAGPRGDVAAGNMLATAGTVVVGVNNEKSEVFARTIVNPNSAKTLWSVTAPDGWRPKAIVLAGDAVLVAAENLDGSGGGVLWRYDLKTGEIRGEARLSGPPRFDGMAVAGGRLFVSTQDGRVIALAGR